MKGKELEESPIKLITDERKRQIEEEKYSTERDDEMCRGDLS